MPSQVDPHRRLLSSKNHLHTVNVKGGYRVLRRFPYIFFLLLRLYLPLICLCWNICKGVGLSERWNSSTKFFLFIANNVFVYSHQSWTFFLIIACLIWLCKGGQGRGRWREEVIAALSAPSSMRPMWHKSIRWYINAITVERKYSSWMKLGCAHSRLNNDVFLLLIQQRE